MKRFIEHTELARDSRFLRQNMLTDVMANLPDDLDTVVEAFDRITPLIEFAVKGTAFEELYEAYGAGFFLTLLNEPLRADDPHLSLRLKLRIHGIFMGELQALEGAARSLWDFPDAPWEFKMNMARQCWDEARHVQTFEKLLAHLEAEVGMFPESTFLFEAACHEDPAMRVAGVNRGLEGLACDAFRDIIRFAEETGDETMRQAVDFVLADELTHVRFGSNWVKEFTRDDPDRARACKEFQREVDKRFSVGGARSGREDAAIPIAEDVRREAGFSDEELRDLHEVSGEGPSKATLQKAAAILRERHQSRTAQEKTS